MVDAAVQPLPLAQDRPDWGYAARGELGEHGPCDLVLRVAVASEPSLPPDLTAALPLLLHELDRQPGLGEVLAQFGRDEGAGRAGGASPRAALARILPRLVTYRFVERLGKHEFVFEGHRASSVHVLGRVLATDFRFRLEDLSHFATHGELLLRVLQRVGLEAALDPEAILYCPALDSPYPFKFAVTSRAQRPNREAYVALLRELLRRTESDEAFRARNLRELARGFQKFGPAAATPQFQEAELRMWRLLTYLAARLRVKAGRLTDARDAGEIATYLAELRHVHGALDDLVHLPGRLAAFYRRRFDLEFSGLWEHTLPELDAIAARIDCDLEDRDKSIDAVAALVSELRRLGSASPLEEVEEQDFEVKRAYGDVEAPEPARGWARTYTDTIHTGAQRFDTRRFGVAAVAAELEAAQQLSEEDFDLDMDLDFGLGGGGADADAGEHEAADEAGEASEETDGWGLEDLDLDAEWGV